MASWNIEQIAAEANDDFLLTHEELMAIFMAHVPTSSDYYALIKAEFEETIKDIDLARWNRDARQQVRDGATSVSIDIPVSVQLPDETIEVSVKVTTNIDVTVTEGGTETKYVIDHDVKIGGKLVTNDNEIVKYIKDDITGSLDDWFGQSTDPVTNPTGDRIEASLTGNQATVQLIDDPSDTRIFSNRMYQLWAVASSQPIEAGDSMNSFVREPTGLNLAVGPESTAPIMNPAAFGLLNGNSNFTGLAVIDFGSQTVVVVDEV